MVNKLVDLKGLRDVARNMAGRLSPGEAVLLRGPLGAGKTTFARALIENLTGGEADIASPSFPLCLTYETPKGTIWHYDLYRLTPPADLDALGWGEARRDGIALLEWPERAGRIEAPGWDVALSFTENEDTRRIEIETLS